MKLASIIYAFFVFIKNFGLLAMVSNNIKGWEVIFQLKFQAVCQLWFTIFVSFQLSVQLIHKLAKSKLCFKTDTIAT